MCNGNNFSSGGDAVNKVFHNWKFGIKIKTLWIDGKQCVWTEYINFGIAMYIWLVKFSLKAQENK